MTGAQTGMWLVFGVVVIALLIVDLWVHRGARADNRKTAIIWSVVWIAAGLGFGTFIWARFGGDRAQEYLAAYLIEKSLSLDNLFVFLIIFQSLKIPNRYQHTVLFWGIFGALVFRGIFIFAGAAALQRWEWLSFVFGGILIYGAYRIFIENPATKRENETVKWLSRHIPVTHEVNGNQFVTVEKGRRVATPLLLALVALELTDIVFAIDSVPAAFAMSRDTMVVYSSNAFAILGLRSLYLVLAHTIAKLDKLHYGLSVVLGFAGAKMISDRWFHVPPLLSVAIIATILTVTVWVSLRSRAARARRDAEALPPAVSGQRPVHQE